jgi:hypothetical protein
MLWQRFLYDNLNLPDSWIFRPRSARAYFGAGKQPVFWKHGSLRSSSNIRPAGASAPSFINQELARFSNHQRFVYYEHVLVSVMQFDDLGDPAGA